MPEPLLQLAIGKMFPDMIIPLIREATKSIDIIVYDWRWYPDQIGSSIQRFNNTIVTAAQRSKQVRVITNANYTIKILQPLKIQCKLWTSKKNATH